MILSYNFIIGNIMGVRIANKEDKRDIYTIMSYCFNYGNDFINNCCNNTNFENDQYLVFEKNGKIDSCISVIPFKMKFNGSYYNMGGIGGVSSLPEDRGNDNIASLMKYSLEYMKERKMLFSALGPFSMSFYRKYGYEWGVTWQLISVPINDFKGFPKANYYKKLNKEDSKLIEKTREEFISKMNGPVFHTQEIIDERFKRYDNEFVHCYGSFDENNNINAIAIYKIEGRELKVEEFYYLNEKGKENMLHFFFVHRSQVDSVEIITTTKDNTRNILPNCRIKYWQWPFVMVRVVMVKEALEAMKIDENIESLAIKVNDSNALWNNKIFNISSSNLNIKVSEESNTSFDFEIDINRLSQLIFGFIDASEAIETNQIKVNNENKVKELKKLFTKKETMMWQKF